MEDKNTPELWNKIWKDEDTWEEEQFHLEKNKKSIRWKRVKEEVLRKYGSFKKLKTIELGSGAGTFSVLFALEGAEVTLVDYSRNALEKSKVFFKRNGVKARFIFGDILTLKKELFGKFDVSMSMGVAEHFQRKEREIVLQRHFEVLKERGLAIIDVPNKMNLPYLAWKKLSQLAGRWKFGEEFPYTRREFIQKSKKLNVNFKFIGGYLFEDPFMILGRIKMILRIKSKKIRREVGTPFDEYFSRTLIALGEK